MGKIMEKILSYRSAFMGIAMMAVVLYHYQVWYNEFSIRIFKFLAGRGYVGVDLFLFFSAVGLSFSFKKNGWKIFYKHRALRILPLYLLLAFYRIISNIALGHNLSLTDIICGITTVGFYIDDGFWIDWYFSLLIALYLLFPLLYFIVRKIGVWSVLLSMGGVLPVLALNSVPWFHDAALSRIPIFLLGIWSTMFYSNKKCCLILIISGLIGFLIPMNLSIFLKWSCWTPIIIGILYLVFCLLKSSVCNIFRFIGRYTLEIYIANCMVGVLIWYSLSPVLLLCVYLLLNVLLAVILAYINRCLSTFERKLGN